MSSVFCEVKSRSDAIYHLVIDSGAMQGSFNRWTAFSGLMQSRRIHQSKSFLLYQTWHWFCWGVVHNICVAWLVMIIQSYEKLSQTMELASLYISYIILDIFLAQKLAPPLVGTEVFISVTCSQRKMSSWETVSREVVSLVLGKEKACQWPIK